jgi:hypothetical protein
MSICDKSISTTDLSTYGHASLLSRLVRIFLENDFRPLVVLVTTLHPIPTIFFCQLLCKRLSLDTILLT